MDEPGVSIGEAAALYGLAPSTLRWWERQGVLPPPGRVAGRRIYRELDLRRIGLAHLYCVTGRMVLSSAAAVTAGKTDGDWHAVVDAEVQRLDGLICELVAARAHLAHMRLCPGDDPALCSELDDEFRRLTPRGRAGGSSLVEAARTSRRATTHSRNETASDRNETPVRTWCAACGGPLTQPSRGRPRTYCSSRCRQRTHRRRHPT